MPPVGDVLLILRSAPAKLVETWFWSVDDESCPRDFTIAGYS